MATLKSLSESALDAIHKISSELVESCTSHALEDKQPPATNTNTNTNTNTSDEAPVRKSRKGGNRRLAVSAETGDGNEGDGPSGHDDDTGINRPPLSEDVQQFLNTCVSKSCLFNHLDVDSMKVLVNSFWEVKKSAGQKIITQGDKGDNFYILHSGTCDVWVQKGKNGKPIKVMTAKTKDSFGELALMYNAPRAASVVANEDCVLYALNRHDFNRILKTQTLDKRSKWLDSLKSVPILQDLSEEELAKLCDVLTPGTFKSGQKIFSQGDEADNFYMIMDGAAVVKKAETPNGIPQVVKQLAKGDYFGEMALIKNQPRAATVEANGHCSVIMIDRQSFSRLLGNCLGAMETGMLQYQSPKAEKPEEDIEFVRRVQRNDSMAAAKKNKGYNRVSSNGTLNADAVLEEEEEEQDSLDIVVPSTLVSARNLGSLPAQVVQVNNHNNSNNNQEDEAVVLTIDHDVQHQSLAAEIAQFLSISSSQFQMFSFSKSASSLYVVFQSPSHASQLAAAATTASSALRKGPHGIKILWGKTIPASKVKELQQEESNNINTTLSSFASESVALQLREAEARERQATAKLREAQAREKRSEAELKIAESRQERLNRELEQSRLHSARLEQNLAHQKAEQENLLSRIKKLESAVVNGGNHDNNHHESAPFVSSTSSPLRLSHSRPYSPTRTTFRPVVQIEQNNNNSVTPRSPADHYYHDERLAFPTSTAISVASSIDDMGTRNFPNPWTAPPLRSPTATAINTTTTTTANVLMRPKSPPVMRATSPVPTSPRAKSPQPPPTFTLMTTASNHPGFVYYPDHRPTSPTNIHHQQRALSPSRHRPFATTIPTYATHVPTFMMPSYPHPNLWQQQWQQQHPF